MTITSGKLIFYSNWIELMLNLNCQGYFREFDEEITDTILNTQISLNKMIINLLSENFK